MLLNCGVGEDSWESCELQGDQTSQSQRKSTWNIYQKDWCQSWSSNSLATWCEELTHWKRPWCSEGMQAGGDWDNRGWDDEMASPTQWTWVWANSRNEWRTGKPSVLQFMGSQRIGHNLVTEKQQKCLLYYRCFILSLVQSFQWSYKVKYCYSNFIVGKTVV